MCRYFANISFYNQNYHNKSNLYRRPILRIIQTHIIHAFAKYKLLEPEILKTCAFCCVVYCTRLVCYSTVHSITLRLDTYLGMYDQIDNVFWEVTHQTSQNSSIT